MSKILRENHVPVVDLDEIAREVVGPETRTLARLVHTFGQAILHPDGTLDRAELGRRVFGDKAKTEQLNAITHTAIRRRMAWRILALWLSGARRVVVDSPLLIEAGMYKWCGQTVVVWW